MAGMLGGGDGMIGQFPLEQWFYEMPVCTRWWTVATVATSVLVQCHVITPFQLFYSYRAVFYKSQVLRDSIAIRCDATMLTRNASIGDSSQPSSISVRSALISSSTCSSSSVTPAFSKSRQAARRPTSHGYSYMHPWFCSA